MVQIESDASSTRSAPSPEEPFVIDVLWPASRLAVLRPCGELDLATLPEFAARLDELLADPPRGLVVDLAGLQFLAACAVREFVRLHGRAATDPRLKVRLAAASPCVARVLRLAGVGLLFELHDTVQGAVDSLVQP